ncbi:ABC transporter ATP-binding protein [Cellulosimicrobium arenosum]|uniref:ABC transporter ATP-binding protein n=1 Tax=Cellulosimicrobium arenosum TaxID=2708133 RepID=A0A927G934_9MICO|nr:ABC transporter ATP-binding protein [Cellulosimicrobium arenosum]MBD8078585.1 ABC transporter ATP-binding protein [Cellulosimicrobium arenosum]
MVTKGSTARASAGTARAATSSGDRTGYPTGAHVRLEGVLKSFPLGQRERLVAVDHVDLELEPGSLTALTGPSGSGKSTLLHLVGAIERADSGSVRVDGHELVGASRARLTRYRRSVGFVFQRFHLLPSLSVLDNVLVPLLPERAERAGAVERARELLDAVGLAAREDALPATLSGGQQQRVAIARALVVRPRLLVADEPTGNLDSRTGRSVLDLLLGLRATHPMTVVLSTHDPLVAAACERTVHILDGRTVAA